MVDARGYSCPTPVILVQKAVKSGAPAMLEVADIYETSVCPLARVMRRELKRRGVEKLKVVYSKEEPLKMYDRTPGSTAFVPPSAGLLLASEVVKDLIKAKHIPML